MFAQTESTLVNLAMEDSGLSSLVTVVTSWEMSESEVFGSDENSVTSRAIIIRGKTSEGNNTTSKVAVDDDGVYERAVGSETCTGVGCQNCDFAPNGGCQCLRVIDIVEGGKCNHTITKEN